MQAFGSMEIQLASRDSTSVQDDEEYTAESDEPPEEDSATGSATPRTTHGLDGPYRFARVRPPCPDGKTSLLSAALAPKFEGLGTRPGREASNASSASYTSTTSTMDLTSDGGFTSPARTNTPSPPPPVTVYLVPLSQSKGSATGPGPQVRGGGPGAELALNEAFGNARCRESTSKDITERKPSIKFVCGRNEPLPCGSSKHVAPLSSVNGSKGEDTPKAPPALRFVCPFKAGDQHRRPADSAGAHGDATPQLGQWDRSRHSNSRPSCRAFGQAEPATSTLSTSCSTAAGIKRDRSAGVTRSEAGRFFAFASSQEEDEDWMIERPAPERRLTVDDTLKKERNIRRIGEEADEEVRQEEEENSCDNPDNDDEGDGDDDQGDEDNDEDGTDSEDDVEEASDGGDESDDEQGFASSDDEADAGSDYSFWTFRRSTAATSPEHTNPSRRLSVGQDHAHSFGNSWSDDAVSPTADARAADGQQQPRRRTPMGSGTPTLPDSTDFVCGTLDEDRPIEDAFASRVAERKRSCHHIIPQDIDPGFPPSDLDEDDEDDEDDDSGEGDEVPARTAAGRRGLHGQAEGICNKTASGIRKPPSLPRRMHSPAPPRRGRMARSPPPRRAAHRSPRRPRLTVEVPRAPSQQSSRPSSAAASPKDRRHISIDEAARAALTRTKSLPHAPNAFYQQGAAVGGPTAHDGRGSRTSSPARRKHRPQTHRRGAIDIVSGLEKKRQRQREKAWLKYCHRAAKGKDRKPPTRGGAERMRELGPVMGGKQQGKPENPYDAQYILSI